MDITKLAIFGGILFILTIVHFIVDWIFQSNKDAMAKHNNPLIRAKHCLIYTVGFVPIMLLMKLELWEMFVGSFILFTSHFYLDTYHAVYLWAKYIRKPNEMLLLKQYHMFKGNEIVVYPTNDKEGFAEFAKTTLGKILMIVVDQLTHIIFLIPLAWMAIN